MNSLNSTAVVSGVSPAGGAPLHDAHVRAHVRDEAKCLWEQQLADDQGTVETAPDHAWTSVTPYVAPLSKHPQPQRTIPELPERPAATPVKAVWTPPMFAPFADDGTIICLRAGSWDNPAAMRAEVIAANPQYMGSYLRKTVELEPVTLDYGRAYGRSITGDNVTSVIAQRDAQAHDRHAVATDVTHATKTTKIRRGRKSRKHGRRNRAVAHNLVKRGDATS